MDHLSGVFESLAIPFKGIADGLGSISSRISGIRSLIGSFWDDISNNFVSVIKYLNPFSEQFFLRIALIPQDGYFQMFYEDLSIAFNNKIPLVTQLADFFSLIKNSSYGTSIPTFKITLPSKYAIGTFDIVDFSYFAEYRTMIVNFIRYSSWFFFLKKLYKKIPHSIY